MDKLNVRKLGLAAGVASAALYVACMITMRILPEETLISFYNSLLHGIDVSPVMRMNPPFGEAIVGIVAWFVIGGALGAAVAGLYNAQAQRTE